MSDLPSPAEPDPADPARSGRRGPTTPTGRHRPGEPSLPESAGQPESEGASPLEPAAQPGSASGPAPEPDPALEPAAEPAPDAAAQLSPEPDVAASLALLASTEGAPLEQQPEIFEQVHRRLQDVLDTDPR